MVEAPAHNADPRAQLTNRPRSDAKRPFSFTMELVDVGGQNIGTFIGSITDGTFDGNTAVMVITVPSVNLLGCLFAPGLEDSAGVSELVITSP